MKWREEDISLLISASDELSEYLNSPVYNWKISSSRLVLTPGRVLLAMTRLSTVSNHDPKLLRLTEAISIQIKTKKVHWQKKVDIEIPSRLKIWENVLIDYQEEGLDYSYSAQVVNRTILNLLERETYLLPPNYKERLHALDDDLQTLLTPGDFIWDKQLITVFPSSDYWFLYGTVKKG